MCIKNRNNMNEEFFEKSEMRNEGGNSRDGFFPSGEGNWNERGSRNFGDRPGYGGGNRPRFGRNPRPAGNEGYTPRRSYGGGSYSGGYRQKYNSENREGFSERPRSEKPRQGGFRQRDDRFQTPSRFGKRPYASGSGEESGYDNHRPSRPAFRNGEGGGTVFRQGSAFRSRYSRQDSWTSNGPARRPSGNYDPHAKYSQKKRLEYKEEHFDPNEPIRLNKYLANAGICSRRDADKYIQAGVVTVNGEVVQELGRKVLRTDTVLFHDEPVSIEKKVYVLLNKPKGYVTTSEDPQNRKTVMDLVKDACRERIYPVGRLDRNTTGVLLLTNDGEMAAKLTHPKFLKKKIYHVHTDQNVTAADMHKISEGLILEDGEIKVDAIEYASLTDKKQVGVEIHSGKNRIVRRIFESLGYHVVKLDRVYFAGLTKKNVRRGDWRFLTEKEVNMLRMGAFE